MSEKDLIADFVGPNASYYRRNFAAIQASARLVATFNPAAAVFGPLWAGMRGFSLMLLVLIFIDLIAVGWIAAGQWGDAGTASRARAEQLEATVAARRAQALAAQAQGDVAASAMSQRLADNLQQVAESARMDAAAAQERAASRVWIGAALLLLARLVTGLLANLFYERRFTAWRGDRGLAHGAPAIRIMMTTILVLFVYGITIYAVTAARPPAWLTTFPADRALFSAVEKWFDAGFAAAYAGGSGMFDGIRNTIRSLVDMLEGVLVGTTWPVVMLMICTLAYLLAGWRVALFTGAGLAYLSMFGFWELSMQTVALLGAASILCVAIGIPVGVLLARSRTAYAVAQPVLDFMQTMPAFVYLIPVIAFFGTGKPPGIIATLIFGMPPIIRLTALGLNGVPEDVKEAARAFGATKWQVLTGVELPLAKASILTGVNQTILMCLSMVVIASLIGAQGLGTVVLQSLQNAAKGQGMLAGLAILVCAMVIDRIVQGSFRRGSFRQRE